MEKITIYWSLEAMERNLLRHLLSSRIVEKQICCLSDSVCSIHYHSQKLNMKSLRETSIANKPKQNSFLDKKTLVFD